VTERRHFFQVTKKEWLIIGSVYMGFMILVVVVLQIANHYSTRPRDAALVRQFYEHRETFEEIKSMLEEDSNLGVVADYGVCPTNMPFGSNPPEELGLTQERFRGYLHLLKKAGASTVFRDDEFRFFVASSGGMGKGYRIAIVFRENAPKELISNLDLFHKTKSEWEIAYRPITNNWYLYIIW
jgi:hypothetical protein